MKEALLSLLFPKVCAFCGKSLLSGEHVLCLVCQSQLPRLYAGGSGNCVENHFFGRIDYVRATSFIYYTQTTSKLLHEAKYHSHPWVNRELAQLFATELQSEGWPHDIDLIMPVPIHWWRRLMRGYNQTYYAALGLAETWHLPIDRSLYKRRYTTSQVNQTYQQRLTHVQDSFGVTKPDRLAGRHVLLVDDVITSGATVEACANALRKACPTVRISILSLAFAHV